MISNRTLTFRDKQLAGLADPARRPAAKTLADLNISDETKASLYHVFRGNPARYD